MTEKDKLIKAKELMDSEIFQESRSIFESINLEKQSPKFIEMRNLFLSHCNQELGNYDKAIELSLTISQKSSFSESASQIRYFSYIGLKEFDKALNEVITFLKNHPAELYKVTLKELTTDVFRGYIQNEAHIKILKQIAIDNKIFDQ